MCRHGIRQIPGRRTRDSIESKLARLRQCHRNHAIFEAQCRQADGIVLDVKILGERTQALSKMRRLEQRREPYWQSWFKALGEGQKLSVAPHVRGPLGNALASERSLAADRVIVVSNFQRRETLIADRTGLVSPGSTAFPTSEFVVRHVSYSLSWSPTLRKARRAGHPRIAEDEPEKAA